LVSCREGAEVFVELVVALVLVVVTAAVWVLWPRLIGAVWLPTSMDVVRKMLVAAEVRPDDVVYDLGSGDGRIILAAAKEFGARAVGIEADPIRFVWSKLRIRVVGLSDMVNVLWGNFFHRDLREASVVTLYQDQSVNNRLREKLKEELNPGTRIVSHSFTFRGWSPARRDEESQVYLYVL